MLDIRTCLHNPSLLPMASIALEQDSSLSSIVPSCLRPTWHRRRLPETELHAQLHAKFWHRTHLKGDPMNVDVDEHTMGDDTEDIEDDDNQISCGFVLHIGIPGVEKLWIRREYIKLYNCCEDYLKSDRQSTSMRAPSLVITGQPGIGKSYWILYALCRRLAEGKPVFWYNDSRRLLFVNEGVYVAPKDFHSMELKTRVWTLVDSNESSWKIPPKLAVNHTQHLNIFTSSPQSERWKPLERTTICGVIIMNPWTRKEILQAASVHGFTNSDHQRINTMYNQFGPTPRICYDFIKDDCRSIEYKARSLAALGSLSLEALRKMVFGAAAFNLTTVSQMLFLVKRVPEKRLRKANMEVDNVLKYAYASVEPITHAVQVAIRNQLWQEKQIDLFEFYSRLESNETTAHAATASLVFKSMGHSRLRERIRLVLFPMMKGGSGGSDLRQRHSIHRHKSTAMPPEFSIDIQPVRVIECPGSSLETIEPGAYYILESENQVAFDSFIVDDNILYIFRFSTLIASNHPIEPGILSFVSQESLPPKTEWRFVLVIPPECPRPPDEHSAELLDGMRLFSATLKKPE